MQGKCLNEKCVAAEELLGMAPGCSLPSHSRPCQTSHLHLLRE